ncbi:MAG: HU family DNA-binding protein [Bacillota bacterium]
MTKTELIEKVAEQSGLTKKDSSKAVEAMLNAMTQALAKNEKVQLVGFGSFEVRKREARKGRNPQTGAEIKIAARKVPVFKAGKALKEAVAKK